MIVARRVIVLLIIASVPTTATCPIILCSIVIFVRAPLLVLALVLLVRKVPARSRPIIFGIPSVIVPLTLSVGVLPSISAVISLDIPTIVMVLVGIPIVVVVLRSLIGSFPCGIVVALHPNPQALWAALFPSCQALNSPHPLHCHHRQVELANYLRH